ncbi:PD-(D/E)XK motif protein [Clostridium gasigenes]|uniref:PD-(D/E)XK motif protein n=1 Tax=Clostridium gasigenes TaxID=94869 RepID=UPI00143859A8|nr:PD-(D/E)XK motif protein [Clostridium gasigenes]NKF07320.1 PD-(D/E)XK motif protein [Clostridium gasigenes]QSW18293.1 PD-(D/E)XK motif protein [Clostridium gasigenes]
MSYLSKIFNDIVKDFDKEEYRNQSLLSRRFALDNDIIFIAYYNNVKKIKELSIKINKNFNKEVISKYPEWSGISVMVSEIENGPDKGIYLSFAQLDNLDENIYVAVLDDIIENIKVIKGGEHLINTVGKVLVKWKQFFKIHNELIMSDIKQQGLYSELIFLKKLINIYGEKALNCWSGCNSETHDFYIMGNAIEIKSTSSNEANSVTISNEYQLDSKDVTGTLYLMFMSLRKSLSDGQTLPNIVEEISSKLEQGTSLEVFEEKLFNYGYLLRKPELYKFGFNERETKYYEICNEFPSITKYKLANGISNVSYKLSLNTCEKYLVLEGNVIRNNEGGII